MRNTLSRRSVIAGGTLLPLCLAGSGQAQNPLSTAVEEFHVEAVPLRKALNALATAIRPGVLFGIEWPSTRNSGTDTLITLQARKESLDSIVGRLTASTGQAVYTADATTNVIVVRPWRLTTVEEEMLALPVAPRRFSGYEWPENLFRRYAATSAEIQRYRHEANLRTAHRTQSIPPGTPGVIMQTEVPPPRFDVLLKGETVRAQLNEIAAHTRGMKDVPSNTSPNGMVKVYPTGWFFRLPSGNGQTDWVNGPELSHFPR